MRLLKFFLPALLIALQGYMNISCSKNKGSEIPLAASGLPGSYTVYIVNNNLHTGIVIPVNSESIRYIPALEYFKNRNFADIGWGEEKFYQNPKSGFCMGAKAILLPNRSVIRIEGYNSFDSFFINWSDFTIRLSLTDNQFRELAAFIQRSFGDKMEGELIITSQKHSGEIIFFRSLHSYHLFNTCNTWVAKALQSAGIELSSMFIITKGQLYDQLKDRGTVLKKLY